MREAQRRRPPPSQSCAHMKSAKFLTPFPLDCILLNSRYLHAFGITPLPLQTSYVQAPFPSLALCLFRGSLRNYSEDGSSLAVTLTQHARRALFLSLARLFLAVHNAHNGQLLSLHAFWAIPRPSSREGLGCQFRG